MITNKKTSAPSTSRYCSSLEVNRHVFFEVEQGFLAGRCVKKERELSLPFVNGL